MLSKSLRGRIRSLHRKKGRETENQFLVEGEKSVAELLASALSVKLVVASGDWQAPPGLPAPLHRADAREMESLTALRTASPVLAVAEIPPEPVVALDRGRWFWLDGIRDPGNLGTILRVVDWFGLSGVVLSPDCVEWTNPKAVQASMGSLFRVPVIHRPLEDLRDAVPTLWCGGTFMDGVPLPELSMPRDGVLVLGSEAAGIRPGLASRLSPRVGIPGGGGAESLNVAMAAGVCAYEWSRSFF